MFFRLTIFVLLVYLIYKIVRKAKNIKAVEKGTAPSPSEDLVEDPFCHKYIPISQAHIKEISGKKHYFCSRECCDKYQSK